MANENVLSLDDDLNSEPNKEQKTGAQPQDTPSGDILSALQELVGEGKKFKDEEALAKSKLETDRFIDHLKDENKGLREDLARLQEEAAKRQVDSMRDQLSKGSDRKTEEVTPSQLSAEDLDRLVEQSVTKREAQRTAKENLDKTNRDLIAAFGDSEKARAAVQERAAKHNLSVEDVTKMAAKSPSGTLAMLGINTSAAPASDITKTSAVDGATSTSGLVNVSLEEQFREMRRKDPRKFWSPSVQRQIFELKKQGKLYS